MSSPRAPLKPLLANSSVAISRMFLLAPAGFGRRRSASRSRAVFRPRPPDPSLLSERRASVGLISRLPSWRIGLLSQLNYSVHPAMFGAFYFYLIKHSIDTKMSESSGFCLHKLTNSYIVNLRSKRSGRNSRGSGASDADCRHVDRSATRWRRCGVEGCRPSGLGPDDLGRAHWHGHPALAHAGTARA